MSSRWLTFSLTLNLVMLGVAGYRIARNHSDGSTPPVIEPISQMSRRTGMNHEFSPAVAAVPAPLRWNEIETEDYPTYVANLRKAGCPEPILHRIIAAELKEFYARKAFALVHEFHRDFWEIAARENVQEYFKKTFGQKVKALGEESDALFKRLVGEAPRELSNTPPISTTENRLMDFLPPAKQEELRRVVERYETQLQLVRQGDLSPEEKEIQLAQLRREMEGEQARILSPAEWAEYQLRQSDAVGELRQLHGVDFSETELRNLVKTIDGYHHQMDSQTEIDPEALEQKLQTVLGPERFADFNRARSASYRELYEVASDFGQPGETAAELFDLRLKSEKLSDAIRSDKNWSIEEKQVLLDDLQEQVEQTMLTKLGAGAYQSYKFRNGRWINSLGRF